MLKKKLAFTVLVLGIATAALAQIIVEGTAEFWFSSSNTSPAGFTLPPGSSGILGGSVFVAYTERPSEESFVAFNEDAIYLVSPGDEGLVQIIDQDVGQEYFRVSNHELRFLGQSNTDKRITNINDSNLLIRTDGALISLLTDTDNDTAQTAAFRVFANGEALSNRALELTWDGNLSIASTLTENAAFDLAESFLVTEPLEPGDLVELDPSRPDAVRRSRGAGGAVLGVVSTKPGILMGGGAFSVEELGEVWGAEVVQRFLDEQNVLQAEALQLESRAELRERARRVESLTSFAGQMGADVGLKAENADKLEAEYAAEIERFADELQAAAIDLFFEKNFAPIALAGRVPVNVEFGSPIDAGDFLAPSSTPGRAKKAEGPGPVIGIALESDTTSDGRVTMLVRAGWHGGGSGNVADAEAAGPADDVELDNLRRENADLAKRVADLEALVKPLMAQSQRGKSRNGQ